MPINWVGSHLLCINRLHSKQNCLSLIRLAAVCLLHVFSFFLHVCNGAKHPKQFRRSRDIKGNKYWYLWQYTTSSTSSLSTMLPPTTILQEPSSGRPMAMILSLEQMRQIAGAETHILWQPPHQKTPWSLQHPSATIIEGSDGTVHSRTLVMVISANQFCFVT